MTQLEKILRPSYNWVDPKSLKPNPKNPNRHSPEQIDRIIRLIDAYGWRHPIIVSNQSGFVNVGHGRLEAALKKKLDLVPVEYQDFKDEDEEFGFMVADIAIAGWADLDLASINLELPNLGPDFDVDLLGIKDFVIEPADKYGDQDADAVGEVRETSIRLGDLFSLGSHRLLCGDATDSDSVARLMNGEKVDMVYTDPPYGIDAVSSSETAAGTIKKGKLAKAGTYKPIIGDSTTIAARDSWKILKDISKNQIIWGGNYFTDFLPVNGHWLVWSKKGYEKTDTFSDAELAWTSFNQVSVKLYSHIWDGMWREGNRDEELKSRVHPTQKPVGLISKMIEDYSQVGHSILDVFLGSGSTLIACEKTNRKCFGMEIDPQYCQVIIDRWEKFTGKKAEKLTGTGN